MGAQNKPDWVLFDLDGTLTDPFEGITGCVQYALEKMGADPHMLNTVRCSIPKQKSVNTGDL